MPASPCSGEGRVQTDVHLGASAWRGSTNWTLECSGKTLLDGALNGKAGRFGLSDDFLNTNWMKLAIQVFCSCFGRCRVRKCCRWTPNSAPGAW